MRASCVGEGSITPELWVNGVKAVDGATWGCSIELPAAVNVDSAMPRLQSSDEVQIRFKELWSNQEAWAVLEPAYPAGSRAESHAARADVRTVPTKRDLTR